MMLNKIFRYSIAAVFMLLVAVFVSEKQLASAVMISLASGFAIYPNDDTWPSKRRWVLITASLLASVAAFNVPT
jgi:hypothetical protein